MRSLEEMLAAIKDIQSDFQQLREDLNDLLNEKNGGALNFDIDEVAVKAKREPITPHPLSNKDEHTKRQYLILLLSVAHFEQDKLHESFLLAHRIAYGCGYFTSGDLMEEYTASHMLTFSQLDELVSLFAKDDLRLMLIEEMLLMVGKFEKGLKPAVDHISQVCELLNITNEEITFLSQMSAVILTGDQSLYNCGRNQYELFNCYLPKNNYMRVIYADIENVLSKDQGVVSNVLTFGRVTERFSQCKSISLNDDILTYIVEYKKMDERHDKTITQRVSKKFVLMANADEIKPNYPVGVASDSLLVSIQTMKTIYDKAVRDFQAIQIEGKTPNLFDQIMGGITKS